MGKKFCCNRKLLKTQIEEIEGDKSFHIVKCGQIVRALHQGYQDGHKEQVSMNEIFETFISALRQNFTGLITC